MTYAICYPGHCFCEGIRNGLILQPANTWSSLAFVIAGIYVAYRYRNSFGYMYAVLLAVIGIGSAYYHARLDFVGQTIDVAGMYLLVTFVILAVLVRARKAFLANFLILNAALMTILVYAPHLRRYVFAGLVGVLLQVLSKRNVSRKVLGASLLVMAVAFAIWTLDITGIWCSPQSWLQGHAIWHILGAVSAVLLFESIQPILSKE